MNGLTGRPIARALVESQDQRIATLSDADGHFAVDLKVNLMPVSDRQLSRLDSANRLGRSLFLRVQKPGYLPSQPITSLALDDTLATNDVVLKLYPTASITGQVSATASNTAANVPVTLLLHQVVGDGGRLSWMQAGSKQTNSRGEYRFSDLRPGEYTVMTGEWFGGRPFRPELSIPTQQYPPVFYGDVPTIESALKLHLHSGDHAQVELHLHPATYYPVRIPVSGTSGAGIGVRLVDDTNLGGFRLAYDSREGAVVGSLPNGHYTFLLSSFGFPRSFALLPVNVANAPVEAAAVALVPAATIRVSVHTQFNATQPSTPTVLPSISGRGDRTSGGRAVSQQNRTPSPVQINLVPVAVNAGNGGQQSGSGEDLVIQNVEPGRYYVRAHANQGYIAALTCGGVDLFENPLIVDSSGAANAIEVTLRDDSATVSGALDAASSSQTLPRAIVFLPMDASAQFNVSFTSVDGKFTATGIAPGSYRVVATRNYTLQLPYRDPEGRQRFEGKGTTLSVSPGQQLHVDVPYTEEGDAEPNG